MFILNSIIMATIKTVLRSYKNKEGKQQITIRVSHKGKTSFHPTGEYILAKYFSTKEGKAKSTLSGWIQINTRLDNLVDTYKQKLNELLVSGQQPPPTFTLPVGAKFSWNKWIYNEMS